MAFTWKANNQIWKGEGIYHVTFVVAGRRPVLGKLVPIEQSRAYSGCVSHSQAPSPNSAKYTSQLATTELSAFGFAVLDHLRKLPERYQDQDREKDEVDTNGVADTKGEKGENSGPVQICAKQFMPDHLHVILWVKGKVDRSIRQIAQGFRIGIRKLAIEMGVCAQDDGHVFEVPFIRTLTHGGQLRTMINYVHSNPDNAWMRRLHPDLYVIRRNINCGGLQFDAMGKSRLLDYPDNQVIALSRSLNNEQIDTEVEHALQNAARGMVTLTAAINTGERAVARAIREAGYPLVVMLLDGFPPEGSDAARHYHPEGIYHQACGEGRLCLLSPRMENYDDPFLIEQTDEELERKAAEKHQSYRPIPHDTKRWRMIAGNVMLKRLADKE